MVIQHQHQPIPTEEEDEDEEEVLDYDNDGPYDEPVIIDNKNYNYDTQQQQQQPQKVNDDDDDDEIDDAGDDADDNDMNNHRHPLLMMMMNNTKPVVAVRHHHHRQQQQQQQQQHEVSLSSSPSKPQPLEMDDGREEMFHGHHRHHHGSSSSSGHNNATVTGGGGGGGGGTANTSQMVVNIIISFVGAGLLGQPHAFSKSGWLLGSITLVAISAANVYAMLRLPIVQQRLLMQQQQQQQSQQQIQIHPTRHLNGNHSSSALASSSSASSTTSFPSSYSDVGKIVLGPYGEMVVIFCLGISQAGFATAYIIFIAANLYNLLHWSRLFTCIICIPGLILLVQYTSLKSLSPFSLLANGANFAALLAVLTQDYQNIIVQPSFYNYYHHYLNNNNVVGEEEDVDTSSSSYRVVDQGQQQQLEEDIYYENENDNVVEAIKWNGLLYVMAVTLYSMEGVGMILSLKASAQKPHQFSSLLTITVGFITIFMVIFGMAGYVAFGDETQAPVTLNLTSHWSATFVKLSLCLGLYLTYPIMMFPIWNIMENIYPNCRDCTLTRFFARSIVVLLSTLVAYSVPNFGIFLRLVGSSICTLLGFILPCYFHLKIKGFELSHAQYCLDVMLLLGGIIFAIVGTMQSIMAMMKGELDGEA